jgi:precorrin-6Y C5,15-methyltransferase (decarboxylating)
MAIHIIGLGVEPDDLSRKELRLINEAQVLVGGERHLDRFRQSSAEKIPIITPLSGVFDQIRSCEAKDLSIVILATGDPLFYGIGQSLIQEFGAGNVTLTPNISMLQAAAARIRIPWNDIATVSLHGRQDLFPLFHALNTHARVAALTDAKHIPSAMAQALLDKGADNYRMWVFEDLGADNERYAPYSLAVASQKNFATLNFVLLEATEQRPQRPVLGAPDQSYVTEKNLITKAPIRAAGIAALRLHPANTLWDLGAGCGAVAIEASALLNQGRVYAVEKKSNRVAHIRENIRRCYALLVEAVHGAYPRCLPELPDPDRVFIGGGLSKGEGLLDAVCDRLKPGGRIVVHCALLDTLGRCKNFFQNRDWQLSVSMLQSSKSSILGKDLHLEGQNPIFILAADKPE